ncbi:peptide chain release factor N(5)-glutamine methyltransferase [uncultured Shimia sp.]|uniref:peptide chain release factor N(5)-glutamine methyltransferase n=1 Tax=uncultured Shimia sp. TaxID=573152 RepID=UPI0026259FF7|nr:peptide chain release factor N(5)-glutamine methyltransferase [uncultured Shimia sp.]
MNVQAALTLATQMLKDAGIPDPARDARKLMAASLGVDVGRVTLHLRDPLEDVPEAAFFADTMERAERKPISHLLGWREFFGRRFLVTPEVLDPRPETETLIEAALSENFEDLLDLGIGTGCILVTLLAERPKATGIGTDISGAALSVAGRNAAAHGVEDRCALIESDWFAVVGGQFDLIVSNPPYIALDEMADLAPELAYEPRMALTDESDGLAAYRVIARDAGPHLKPGGRLMVEIGWTQGADVAAIFKAQGFVGVRILQDMDGRDRVVLAQTR